MRNERFETIMDLEDDVQGCKASVTFAPTGLPMYLLEVRHEALKAARRGLMTAIDALTPAEMQEFGKYRIAHR